MQIELRFFASVREQLGVAHEAVTVPDTIGTVGELRAWLRERGDVWRETLAEGRALRMACNQQMADTGTAVSNGCEIAFFPPVTGG